MYRKFCCTFPILRIGCWCKTKKNKKKTNVSQTEVKIQSHTAGQWVIEFISEWHMLTWPVHRCRYPVTSRVSGTTRTWGCSRPSLCRPPPLWPTAASPPPSRTSCHLCCMIWSKNMKEMPIFLSFCSINTPSFSFPFSPIYFTFCMWNNVYFIFLNQVVLFLLT